MFYKIFNLFSRLPSNGYNKHVTVFASEHTRLTFVLQYSGDRLWQIWSGCFVLLMLSSSSFGVTSLNTVAAVLCG